MIMVGNRDLLLSYCRNVNAQTKTETCQHFKAMFESTGSWLHVFLSLLPFALGKINTDDILFGIQWPGEINPDLQQVYIHLILNHRSFLVFYTSYATLQFYFFY